MKKVKNYIFRKGTAAGKIIKKSLKRPMHHQFRLRCICTVRESEAVLFRTSSCSNTI